MSLKSKDFFYKKRPYFFAMDVNGVIVSHYEVKKMEVYQEDKMIPLQVLADKLVRKSGNIYAKGVALHLTPKSTELPDYEVDVEFKREGLYSTIFWEGVMYHMSQVRNLRHRCDVPSNFLDDEWLFYSVTDEGEIDQVVASWTFTIDKVRKGANEFIGRLKSDYHMVPIFVTGASVAAIDGIFDQLNETDDCLVICGATPEEKAEIIAFLRDYGKELSWLQERKQKRVSWKDLKEDLNARSLWKSRLEKKIKKVSAVKKLFSMEDTIAYIADGENDVLALREAGSWSFSFASHYTSAATARASANILLTTSPEKYFSTVEKVLRTHRNARIGVITLLSFAGFYGIFSVLMVLFRFLVPPYQGYFMLFQNW